MVGGGKVVVAAQVVLDPAVDEEAGENYQGADGTEGGHRDRGVWVHGREGGQLVLDTLLTPGTSGEVRHVMLESRKTLGKQLFKNTRRKTRRKNRKESQTNIALTL